MPQFDFSSLETDVLYTRLLEKCKPGRRRGSDFHAAASRTIGLAFRYLKGLTARTAAVTLHVAAVIGLVGRVQRDRMLVLGQLQHDIDQLRVDVQGERAQDHLVQSDVV